MPSPEPPSLPPLSSSSAAAAAAEAVDGKLLQQSLLLELRSLTDDLASIQARLDRCCFQIMHEHKKIGEEDKEKVQLKLLQQKKIVETKEKRNQKARRRRNSNEAKVRYTFT